VLKLIEAAAEAVGGATAGDQLAAAERSVY
ncbi:MAG: hypothetical protein QOI71_2923, partial [Gaiellales bacterium]|nr:hypothetical protein [Gaiellales bacterium]